MRAFVNSVILLFFKKSKNVEIDEINLYFRHKFDNFVQQKYGRFNNKYMIAPTHIRNTKIFAFIGFSF